MKLHIERSLTPDFVNAVDAVLDLSPLPEVSHKCPHCGLTVRYPKVARERDIESLQELVAIAEKYIEDKGVAKKMLAECLSAAHIAIARKGAKS